VCEEACEQYQSSKMALVLRNIYQFYNHYFNEDIGKENFPFHRAIKLEEFPISLKFISISESRKCAIKYPQLSVKYIGKITNHILSSQLMRLRL
jgi:hypothetical protein